MDSPTLLRAFRRVLLSASSLTLVSAYGAPALAQNDTSQPPSATAAPQPSASPSAQSSPTPQSSTTPAPAQQPAQAPTPSTPAVQAQPPGTTVLPETRVAAPIERRRPPPSQVVRNPPPPAAPSPEQVQAAANRQVVQQTQNFDQRRDNVILPKTGASTYELTQRDIENIPQGNAIQLSDLALQFPGVTQDSTSQGDFHIRNEHGNVQYRINGILLPDGVSGFSQILETSFIGSMQLITGALPAQYGLHTSGVIDITSKSGAALAGGSVSVYGGSRQAADAFRGDHDRRHDSPSIGR
jgi:hypothetical protein